MSRSSLESVVYNEKLVVVGGDQPFYTDDGGISFVGIIPFLLDKSILSGMTSGMKLTAPLYASTYALALQEKLK